MFARYFQFLLLWCLLSISMPSWALITITIDKGIERGVPIAIVPFGVETDLSVDFKVSDVIRSDLERTGRFDVLDPDGYISQPTSPEDIVFSDWQLIKVDFFLIGRITRDADSDKVLLAVRLYDTFEQKQVTGEQFIATEPSELRKIAHRISNMVFEKVTGERSSFDTKILYTTVVENAVNGRVEHKLFIADYDGYQPKEILKTDSPILSPSLSPDSKLIVYSELGQTQSKMYLQQTFDPDGKRQELTPMKTGHNRSPSWSPDGKRIAFTNTQDGNSDIYVYSIASHELIQVTRHRLIDTEPAWSPDGEQIIFTSNRSKNPQIYQIRLKQNSRPIRITREGTSNTGAKYSPDGGRLILITDQSNGSQVGVFDLESQELNVVSPTNIDDSAGISPHGDMLIYVVEGQNRQIQILSPNGNVSSSIPIAEGRVKQVTWGPKPDYSDQES